MLKWWVIILNMAKDPSNEVNACANTVSPLLVSESSDMVGSLQMFCLWAFNQRKSVLEWKERSKLDQHEINMDDFKLLVIQSCSMRVQRLKKNEAGNEHNVLKVTLSGWWCKNRQTQISSIFKLGCTETLKLTLFMVLCSCNWFLKECAPRSVEVLELSLLRSLWCFGDF